MITEVLNGIAEAIAAAFPDHEIYIDNPLQGMLPPCFLLDCISPDRPQIRGDLYRWDVPVVINYFPKDNDNNDTAFRETAEKLIDALEVITVKYSDESINIKRESGEFGRGDGFLEYTVRYVKEFWYKPQDAELMQKMERKNTYK